MVPNSTVMTVEAIFKSRLLKMAAAGREKFKYLCKIRDEAEVVQCPFNISNNLEVLLKYLSLSYQVLNN